MYLSVHSCFVLMVMYTVEGRNLELDLICQCVHVLVRARACVCVSICLSVFKQGKTIMKISSYKTNKLDLKSTLE